MRLSEGMPTALVATVAIIAAIVLAILLSSAKTYGGQVAPDVWDGVARQEKIGIVFRADAQDYLLAFRDTQAADAAVVAEAVRLAPRRCRVTGTARRSESVGLSIRVDKIEVLK